MNGNPYGAVPEALKETRLTLRDLMAAHLENKVAEGRLGLEKAKAETELAMVGANIKRDEIANLRDTARMQQGSNQFEQGQAQQAQQFNQGQELSAYLHQQEAGQREREFTENKRLQEKGLNQQATAEQNRNDINLKELAIRQREEQRNNEVKSAGTWAKMGGISPAMLKVLGIDENVQMTRQDGKQYLAGLQENMKAHPSMQYILQGNILREELSQMQKAMVDPNLPPAQAAAIQKTYNSKMADFELIDKVIMATKQPDQAKVIEGARRLWQESPELAGKYKNFEEYSQDYQKSVSQARGMFHDDINSLKIQSTKQRVSPNYDAETAAAAALIKSRANPTLAEGIRIGYERRGNSGDYAGAYKYLIDHARQLSQTAGGAATANTTVKTPAAAPRQPAPAERKIMQENIRAAEEEAKKRSDSASAMWGGVGDAVRSKFPPPGPYIIPSRRP